MGLQMPATPKGLSEEKAARMMAAHDISQLPEN
jgi:hypothetical protein